MSEEQKEPEPRLADYRKGRREDVKWVWREGPIERERILEVHDKRF